MRRKLYKANVPNSNLKYLNKMSVMYRILKTFLSEKKRRRIMRSRKEIINNSVNRFKGEKIGETGKLLP